MGPLIGGALMAGASGVGPDGTTPLLLVYAADPARILVYRVQDRGDLLPVFTKETAYSDGTPLNILKNEATDRNVEGIRYAPTTAFALCHGLIVACCQVHTRTGNVWTRVRTAVCYYDLAAPSLGWRYVDPGAATDSQPGLYRGSAFQMPGYGVLDEGPVLRAWFPFSDYVQNNQATTPGSPNARSDTGIFYLINAVRPAVGSAWVVGPLAPVYSPPARTITPVTVSMGQHAHPPYLERFGVAGLRLVCPVGDSAPNNRVVVAYRTDENYSQPNWAIFENMHGSFGTEIDSAVGVGNQFVGSAPVGAPYLPLGHVVGSDESGVALAITPADVAPGTKLNFMRLYGQPTASYNHGYAPARSYAWNVFHIRNSSPESGGPFVAQMLPGMQAGWMFDATVPRILVSHDGLTWGQAWAPQDIQPWPPLIAGGRIFVGSADRSRSFGLRSIPVPATYGARPLMVGSGGVNLLRTGEDILAPSSVDTGNRVRPSDRGRLAARGIPMPPTLGPVYECIVGATLPVAPTRRVATWRLTAAGAIQPKTPGYGNSVKVKVRAWLYPLPCGPDQPHANSLSVHAALGRFDGNNPANPAGGAREEFMVPTIPVVGDGASGWIPLTLDTDSARWVSDGGQPAATSTPFGLAFRLRTDTGFPVSQAAFLVAFESVFEGGASAYGVPPVTAGAFSEDVASVGGFQCGSEWTIRLAGEVPDDAWDQTLEPAQSTTPLTLCTLHQDAANHIQLVAAPSARALNIVVTRAGIASTHTLKPRGDSTGRERFCFLRGSPILLSVAQRGDKLDVSASVGGSFVATMDVPSPRVRPNRILLGNPLGKSPAAMHWYGGRIDPLAGIPSQEAASSLARLQFLSN